MTALVPCACLCDPFFVFSHVPSFGRVGSGRVRAPKETCLGQVVPCERAAKEKHPGGLGHVTVPKETCLGCVV